MDNNLSIGFFDSGVGGLSVYSEFKKIMPFENTVYFGDLKNLPYGNKSKEELVCFAKNILNFFRDEIGVKAVVIACNTSSALAYESIKEEYDFPIYPIIQSCAEVIAGMNLNRIGVFATQGTVNSKAYTREILKFSSNTEIKEIACPNWVSLVEGLNNNFEDVRFHIEEMLKFSPDKIILGCTHYPYLLKELSKYAPKDIFIDPAKIFAKYISEKFADIKTQSRGGAKEEFFVSANPDDFIKNSKLFYNCKSVQLKCLENEKELCV